MSVQVTKEDLGSAERALPFLGLEQFCVSTGE